MSALSLLFADIAILRGFAAASNLLALADVYVISGQRTPMSRWHARWNLLFLTTNLVWLVIIVNERFAWLTEEEEELYLDAFSHCFSRPQFRALLKKGSCSVASEPTVIIEEAKPSNVFLILDSQGAYVIAKGRRIEFGASDEAPTEASTESTEAPTFQMKPKGSMLVGEASYLSGRDASARVVVERGCSYIKWEREVLRTLEDRETSAELHKRVEVWLGLALSEKLRTTTATFVASADEIENTRAAMQEMAYEAEVRHHAFEREQSGDAPARSFRALLDALAEYRREKSLPDELHRVVMVKLGLPVALAVPADGEGDWSIDGVRQALRARPAHKCTPSLVDAAEAKRAAALRIFAAIDIDGNGEISREELAEHFRKRQRDDLMLLDHIFSELDQDQSGAISLEEFEKSIDTFCRATRTTLPLQVERG